MWVEDIILSRGPGYRFAPSLTVRLVTQPGLATPPGTNVPDVPDHNVPNVPDVPDRDVPDVPDHDVPDVPDHDVPDVPDDPDETNEASGVRKAWILKQLEIGRDLRAPDVAERFDCSIKTAKRDLQALRKGDKIEFVGDARTGSYRLKQPPESRS